MILKRYYSTRAKSSEGTPCLGALPEAIFIVLYVSTIEICQDVDKTSPVLVVGDSPTIIAFTSKISKCGIRHGVFWSKVVEENSELVHGDPQVRTREDVLTRRKRIPDWQSDLVSVKEARWEVQYCAVGEQ